MDRVGHLCFYLRTIINRFPDDVEHPAEYLVSYGNGDLGAFIYRILTPS